MYWYSINVELIGCSLLKPSPAGEDWVGINQTILFFKTYLSEPKDKTKMNLHAFIFPSPNPLPLERAKVV